MSSDPMDKPVESNPSFSLVPPIPPVIHNKPLVLPAPLDVPALVTLISASPVVMAAQVVAGIYGAYTSSQMANAIGQISDLADRILSGLEALKIEIEQLAINRIVAEAMAVITSLDNFAKTS
ncbi:MAG: hypothetical protein ACLQU5_30930 [Isosphaeraceae bacterium]